MFDDALDSDADATSKDSANGNPSLTRAKSVSFTMTTRARAMQSNTTRTRVDSVESLFPPPRRSSPRTRTRRRVSSSRAVYRPANARNDDDDARDATMCRIKSQKPFGARRDIHSIIRSFDRHPTTRASDDEEDERGRGARETIATVGRVAETRMGWNASRARCHRVRGEERKRCALVVTRDGGLTTERWDERTV